MDPIGVVRALAGGVALFVLPGAAWALALRPGLRRDPIALAFWAIATSVALLVLYGTALGLLGVFRASTLLAAALGIALVGGVVAVARRDVGVREVDPGADGRARVARLREATLAGDREAKARLEAEATRELYGR
ncbi:MAG TPA: hypothetical protein VI997_10020 [Candidatus Thermoplasmatota archaeon]|nr:hypothetical protein [Candidatus Thermoplasmatota archaeon]